MYISGCLNLEAQFNGITLHGRLNKMDYDMSMRFKPKQSSN